MKAHHIFVMLSHKHMEELQTTQPLVPNPIRQWSHGGYIWADIPKEHRNAIARTIRLMFKGVNDSGFSIRRKHLG